VRLCLENETRIGEAFEFVEKSRSRSLLEMMQKSGRETQPLSANDSDLPNKIADLREELNWLYNQINQPTRKNTSRNLAKTLKLHEAARKRETEITELVRQLQLHQPSALAAQNKPLKLADLQTQLGSETVENRPPPLCDTPNARFCEKVRIRFSGRRFFSSGVGEKL